MPVIKRYSVAESAGVIICDDEKTFDDAMRILKQTRLDIKSYIKEYPDFKLTFVPWNLAMDDKTPSVIRRMVHASKVFNVGPMACVAGAIADEVFENIVNKEKTIENLVIENGGEIRIKTTRDLLIGLYCGPSKLKSKIGFNVKPRLLEFSGVGTSSATFGHALSFGRADIVTVFCKNAALADAAATYLCNMTDLPDEEESINKVLDEAKKYHQITGVLVAHGKHVGIVGKLPEMVKLKERGQSLLDIYLK
ncbi:MAG: UPF0280 family protein [Promethearchaeota archaeon]